MAVRMLSGQGTPPTKRAKERVRESHREQSTRANADIGLMRRIGDEQWVQPVPLPYRVKLPYPCVLALPSSV
jgi:hypothetical protein